MENPMIIIMISIRIKTLKIHINPPSTNFATIYGSLANLSNKNLAELEPAPAFQNFSKEIVTLLPHDVELLFHPRRRNGHPAHHGDDVVHLGQLLRCRHPGNQGERHQEAPEHAHRLLDPASGGAVRPAALSSAAFRPRTRSKARCTPAGYTRHPPTPRRRSARGGGTGTRVC